MPGTPLRSARWPIRGPQVHQPGGARPRAAQLSEDLVLASWVARRQPSCAGLAGGHEQQGPGLVSSTLPRPRVCGLMNLRATVDSNPAATIRPDPRSAHSAPIEMASRLRLRGPCGRSIYCPQQAVGAWDGSYARICPCCLSSLGGMKYLTHAGVSGRTEHPCGSM